MVDNKRGGNTASVQLQEAETALPSLPFADIRAVEHLALLLMSFTWFNQ